MKWWYGKECISFPSFPSKPGMHTHIKEVVVKWHIWYVKLLNDTLSNVQTHTTDNTCNNTCRKYSKYIFFHLNFTFFFFDEIPKSYNFYVISGIRSIYNCRISFHGKIWKWKEHADVAMVVCVFLILWDIPCVNLITLVAHYNYTMSVLRCAPFFLCVWQQKLFIHFLIW